jgi:hypothetical protein
MWGIFDHRKLRHCFGGLSGKPIALCGIEGDWPLDYARGAKNKKCKVCEEKLGRRKEVQNVGDSGNITN